MSKFIPVPNIVESNGKTVRENNLKIPHAIPLKTFVEVDLDYSESHGCRGFVVEHQRDCDGTPLYGIAFDPTIVDTLIDLGNSSDPLSEQMFRLTKAAIKSGLSDDCLIIIHSDKV